MELGARVEVRFAAPDRRHDALILALQVDPGLIVIGRRDRSVEHAPAPFVDQVGEGHERDLVHRLAQQQSDVLVGRRDLAAVEQADLDEIFGRDRQSDEVADRLMDAVVGAVLEQEGCWL